MTWRRVFCKGLITAEVKEVTRPSECYPWCRCDRCGLRDVSMGFAGYINLKGDSFDHWTGVLPSEEAAVLACLAYLKDHDVPVEEALPNDTRIVDLVVEHFKHKNVLTPFDFDYYVSHAALRTDEDVEQPGKEDS